ncbi:hypothetical protein [Enterovirga rhinocerotis]|uniref:Porin n=1 Tax=Enterovirga rhinocerotis TaxID=1339210 RepID=A0A4R7BQT5_9HYPH|nr:hypothetical protein [Enterovirga rhinocerotis]TDR88034.1 hypothetical protein EV668_3899 [Enterovirga rhinocerotis]
MRRIASPLAFAVLVMALPALAAPCPAPGSRAKASRADCPPVPKKFEPYDPDGARASRGRGGFVDVGGGTEVRVGGRVRFDYDRTR